MPIDAFTTQLAKSHLGAGIAELEKDATGGRYNTICIRALASAATVLRIDDIADRALSLLRAASDEAFWAGAITNIQLPKTIPERLRTVDALEELEKQHPPYREEHVVERIRASARTEEHLARCLNGRLQDARAMAWSGVQIEEIGDTFAVLGEFDNALSIARDQALDDFRRRGVLFVLVIELFRRGRIEESTAIVAELE